jgi:hypothetical protein
MEGMLSGLSLLFGSSGAKKSFLAVAWGAAVASGKAWCEHRTSGPAPVAYIVGEGGAENVARRMREAVKDLGADPESIPYYLIPQAVSMDTEVDDLIETLKPLGPDLVIIDTLSQCMPGEENKQEVMQAFIRACNRIRMEFNCCVLIIHHTPVSDKNRPRGSSVLIGAVDTAFAVSAGVKEGEYETVVLKVKKLKDLSTEGFEPSKLRAVTVDCKDSYGRVMVDNYGDETTTLVLRSEPTKTDEAIGAFAALAAARDLSKFAIGRLEWREAAGLPKTTFRRVVNAILAHPEEHHIVKHRRGQYTYEGNDPKRPGLNVDTTQEEQQIDRYVDEQARRENEGW